MSSKLLCTVCKHFKKGNSYFTKIVNHDFKFFSPAFLANTINMINNKNDGHIILIVKWHIMVKMNHFIVKSITYTIQWV